MVWKAFILCGNLDELNTFVINDLRPIIKKCEAEKWIHGFNYNFYSGKKPNLSLRLDLKKARADEQAILVHCCANPAPNTIPDCVKQIL